MNHLLKDQPKIIPYKTHLQTIAGYNYYMFIFTLTLYVFIVKFENLHKLRSEISVVEKFNLSAYQTFIQQVEHTPDLATNYTTIISVYA